MGAIFKKQDLVNSAWVFLLQLSQGVVAVGQFAGREQGRMTALLMDVASRRAIPEREGLAGTKVMPVNLDLSGYLSFGHNHLKMRTSNGHCSVTVSESVNYFEAYSAKGMFGEDPKAHVREFEAYRIDYE